MLFLAGSCSKNAADSQLKIVEISTPAARASGEPNLFVSADNEVYLSWLERRDEGGHALRLSVMQNDRWSLARTIAQGENWFVNWADFPAVSATSKGRLAAHWLTKSGEGTYAYDVKIAQSEDQGETWGSVTRPHKDGTQTEHGFVSMLPWFENQLGVVWLDGRNFALASNGQTRPSNEMTLRFATLDAQGLVANESILDARVCECCQTSAVRTARGAIVAYRDRTQDEIRDIAVVRWEDGGWTESQIVFADGWRFPGCPVNGPALAAVGQLVAVAWFTAANDVPRIRIAFSSDNGETFGQPIQLNDGEALGRVDVVLHDGSALVSWLESTNEGGEIRICRVRPNGAKTFVSTLAKISTGRASGFPRMVRASERIYFAWTEVGNPTTVRTAFVTL